MIRARRKLLTVLAGLATLLIAAYLKRVAPPEPQPSTPPRLSDTRQCVRVVDGDTIVLDGGERVRLIGVDTPETVDPRRPVQRFGKEARRSLAGRWRASRCAWNTTKIPGTSMTGH